MSGVALPKQFHVDFLNERKGCVLNSYLPNTERKMVTFPLYPPLPHSPIVFCKGMKHEEQIENLFSENYSK